MSTLIVGTQTVNTDELCLLLTEQNLVSPDSRGWRRYQILLVMRMDRPAEMRRDLGPADSFKTEQFRIPGGAKDGITGRFHLEHTVGELIDIADHIRAGMATQPEQDLTVDLIGGYHDEMAARAGRRVGRKSFGHGSFPRRVA